MELAEWRSTESFYPPFSPSDENASIMASYLNWCQDRNLSPQTLRSYRSTLGALAEWAGTRHLEDVTTAELEAFVMRRRVRRGRNRTGSPATRRREVSCLRAFWSWALGAGILRTNPAEPLVGPKVNNRNPRPVPDEVWNEVWRNESLTDGERVMLGLGFFCGLRRYELSSLLAGQVSNTRINDFTRKGGGEHTLPWREMVGVFEDRFPELLVDEDMISGPLLRLRKRDGHLLPWLPAGDPQVINKRLYLLLDRVGLQEDLWFTPHQLRHSCATNLLRASVPLHLVASLLNHTNTTITMRYVAAGGTQLREWRRSTDG